MDWIEALLERTAELAEMTRLVDRAASGKGTVAIVEGAAGIGKTRMCEAAVGLASERGLLSLTARGSELETGSSFGLVRQLFEAPLSRLDEHARQRILSGPASWAALAVGWPDAPSVPGSDDAGAPDRSARTMHGLLWAMSNLAANRPILVCVDDAHWADPPSLRWLTYLAKRVAQLPLMMVLSIRTGEPVGDPALAAILQDSAARTLHLRPLTRDGTGRLLREAFGREPDEAFAAACHVASGGNPFLLRELAFALVASNVEPTADQVDEVGRAASPSISRFVQRRLERLEAGAAELSRAVAVLGSGARLLDAAALADLEPDRALGASSALIRAGLLVERRTEDGDLRLDFKHPLFRASVYGELELTARTDAHRAAARLLAQRGADCNEVASQVIAAGSSDDPAAVAAVREAGLRALAAGAPDVAAQYLRCARENVGHPIDPELTLQLGVAEARSGALSALDHLEEAFNALVDPRARAQAGAELALMRLMSGSTDGVKDAMEAAIDAAEEVDREFALRLEATLLPVLRASLLTTPLRKERLEHASAVSGETPAERALLAVAAADHAATGTRSVHAVRRLSERAAAEGQLLRDEISGSASVIGLAAALIFSDQLREADRHLTVALDDASKRSALLSHALLSSWRAFARLRLGDVARGLGDAEAAKRLADEHGLILDRPLIVATVGDLLRESDQLAASLELLEAFPAARFADAGSANIVLHARGLGRAARGQAAAALDDLLECGRLLARWEAPNPIVMPWRSDAAILLLSLGETSRAQALVDEELELARRYGAASAIGIALHACGLLAPESRRRDFLREAVATLEPTEARLAHIRALISLGSASTQQGHRTDARAALSRALELAEPLGALALARHARAELVAAGARPRRAATRGIDALTPSERRVVELATQGLSNREIAEALFLTLRTVEMHLSASYRKLGISSRTQLPRVGA